MKELDLMNKRMFGYMKKNLRDSESDMAARLQADGGYKQQDRMIYNKKRSLDRALFNSYQGADIQLPGKEPCRALINPDKLKTDYDDKILSINFDYEIKEGDIFDWLNTGTKWLVYLRDYTELAYFRAEIRRCRYEVQWKDGDQIHKTYAAIRGPVETSINSVSKHNTILDTPNYTLHILMPLTDQVKKYFKRYAKFYLQDNTTCWEVTATDYISTPGIFELTAKEYYSNKDTDDVENGIVDGLIVKPVDPNPPTSEILGDTFIKPKREYIYIFNGSNASNWSFDNQLPIESREFINDTGKPCIAIKWNVSYSGQFDLYYGDCKKTIVIESLF